MSAGGSPQASPRFQSHATHQSFGQVSSTLTHDSVPTPADSGTYDPRLSSTLDTLASLRNTTGPSTTGGSVRLNAALRSRLRAKVQEARVGLRTRVRGWVRVCVGGCMHAWVRAWVHGCMRDFFSV